MVKHNTILHRVYAVVLLMAIGCASAIAVQLEADISYQDKGFTFETTDNRFKLQIQGRIQPRFASPSDVEPTALDDYYTYSASGNKMGINRARLKLNGHAYQPWIKFAIEHDFVNSVLLTYEIKLEKYRALKFKGGQWKFEYSRERVISSGAQQMLDRSIINRIFTIDRQQGVAVYGNLGDDSMANFSYWLGMGTGNGRGANADDGGDPLYFGRLQWNMTGSEFGFTASDLKYHESPKAAIAVAYSTNQSAYTRFSSSGGGQLEGFGRGTENRYKINQYNVDFALMYRGLSAQGEYHEKTVQVNASGDPDTDYRGYYLQAGYMGYKAFSWWPQPLEVAMRYATYHQVDNALDEKHFEQALAANWFFNGHSNKLTADVTRFNIEQTDLGNVDEVRYRLQWDLSF